MKERTATPSNRITSKKTIKYSDKTPESEKRLPPPFKTRDLIPRTPTKRKALLVQQRDTPVGKDGSEKKKGFFQRWCTIS